MLLLKSIFICSEYLIWQKSFMEEMSKECVLQNLNLGHWCQVLGLVLVLHLKSWILGPGSRVWILIIRCDNYCKAGTMTLQRVSIYWMQSIYWNLKEGQNSFAKCKIDILELNPIMGGLLRGSIEVVPLAP